MTIIIRILLLVNGLGAIAAGYAFIRYPDGSALGMDPSILQYSPFNDFVIPGIVLFICNGLLSLFTFYLYVRGTRRADIVLVIQGIILTGWIIIQMIMLRDANFMHGIFGVIGLVFITYGFGHIRKTSKQNAVCQ